MYTIKNYNPDDIERYISAMIEINTVPLSYYCAINNGGMVEHNDDNGVVIEASSSISGVFNLHDVRPSGFTIFTDDENLLPYNLEVNLFDTTVTSREPYKTIVFLITDKKQECLFKYNGRRYGFTLTSVSGGDVKCTIIPGIIRQYTKEQIINVKSSTLLKPGCITIPSGTLRARMSCQSANIFPDETNEFFNTLGKYARIIFKIKINEMQSYENIWFGFFDSVEYSESQKLASITASDAMNNRSFLNVGIMLKDEKKFSDCCAFKSGKSVTNIIYPDDRAEYIIQIPSSAGDVYYNPFNRDTLKDLSLFLFCDTYIDREGAAIFRSITEDAETIGITEYITQSKTMIKVPDLRYSECYGKIYVGVNSDNTDYCECLPENNSGYNAIERIIPFTDKRSERARWACEREQISKVFSFDDRGNINRELGDYVSLQTSKKVECGYITRIDYDYRGTLSSYLEVSCVKDEEAVYLKG